MASHVVWITAPGCERQPFVISPYKSARETLEKTNGNPDSLAHAVLEWIVINGVGIVASGDGSVDVRGVAIEGVPDCGVNSFLVNQGGYMGYPRDGGTSEKREQIKLVYDPGTNMLTGIVFPSNDSRDFEIQVEV